MSCLTKGLQTTARRSNPAREVISFGRKDILSFMEKYYMYEKFVDLVECNIPRNNHITFTRCLAL